MDWEQVIRVGLLLGVGVLVLSRSKFNGKYFIIALICIALLWGLFSTIGYE